MRKLFYFLIVGSLLSVATITNSGCSKNEGGQSDGTGDDKKTSASIVGKWKLVEREEDALPNLRTVFRGPPEGTIFQFKSDYVKTDKSKTDKSRKQLVITRNVLNDLKLKDIFGSKKKEGGEHGFGIFEIKGAYKLKGKKITIEVAHLNDPQDAEITTLTATELVLTDKNKKKMKFKRQ